MSSNVINKISKLLNLAEGKGTTPEEAATAAAQASRLMTKYGIELAEIEANTGTTQVEDPEETKLWEGGKVVAWVLDLAEGLCRLHQSRVLIYKASYWGGCSSGAKLTIVGTPSNAAVVRYMLNYLVREIDRLAKAVDPERAYEAGVSTRAYRGAFRKGAALEVIRRMKWEQNELKDEVREQGKSTALVRLDQDEERAKTLVKRISSGGSYSTNGSVASNIGFSDGRRAGSKIRVSRGLGAGKDSGKLLN